MQREDYARRIAKVAAAQSTGAQPRPDYAFSMAAGAAPMPQAAYNQMVNTIQYDAEAVAQAEEQRKMFLENVGGLFSFVERLRRGAKAKRDSEFTWWDTFDQDDDKTAFEDIKSDAGAIFGGIGSALGQLFNPNSDFNKGLSEKVFGEEATAEVDEVSGAIQGGIGKATAPVMDAIDKMDQFVDSRVQAENIAGERGASLLDQFTGRAYFDGDLQGEAWERAEVSTAGQGILDDVMLSPEERAEAYEKGFDEFGNPLDEQYRQMRESNTVYNVGSGLIDFTATWFADPLVVVGKGASVGRAIYKGDTLRMGPATRRRFLEITTAPDSAIEAMTIRKLDPVGQRALHIRREQDALRDAIRAGDEDALTLTRKVQAFQESPMAAEAFARSAQVRKWDPEVGAFADEFDDDAFRVGVAAIMAPTSARAREILESDARLIHVRDAINVMEDGGKLKSIDDEIAKAEDLLAQFEGKTPLRFSSKYEAIQTAEKDLPTMRLEAQGLREQLKEYHEYEDWYSGLLNSVEQGTITMAPRESSSIGETFWSSFKPNAASTKSHTVVGSTKAAFMRRPGVANLHDGNQTFQSVDRYFDSLMARTAPEDLGRLAAESRSQSGEAYTSFASMRDDYLRQVLAATTDTQRRAVVARVEEAALNGLYKKHGIDPSGAAALTAEFRRHRGKVFDDFDKKHQELGALGQSDRVPEGFSSYAVADGDEVVEHLFPLSATELKNTAVLTDLQAMDQFLAQHGEGLSYLIRQKAGRAGDLAEEAFTWYTRFWKPSVLFRFGYAIRNVTDEMLRGIAVASSFPTLVGYSAASGARSVARGAAKGANRAARRAAKTRFVGRRARRVLNERDEVFPVLKPYGQRSNKIADLEFEGLYEPGAGDVFRGEISEEMANRRLIRYHETAYARLQEESTSAVLKLRHEQGFAEAWRDTLVNHIGTDQIYRQMLDGAVAGRAVGETDEAIAKWLRTTREGRELSRRLPWNSHNPNKWVQEMRAVFNEMVPDAALASKLLDTKDVPVEELRRILAADPTRAPRQVNGMVTNTVTGKGALADTLNRLVERGYHVLGTVPTDVLVRHPFANQQYRAMLRQQVDNLPAGGEISDSLMRKMEQTARQHAVKQTRRYMFSLADDTNMVHFMRFMSPFMGAWQESMLKWGRILTESPEAMARIWVNGWADTDELYGVQQVTEDGLTEEAEAELAKAEGRDTKPLDYVQLPVLGRTMKALDFMLPGDAGKAGEIFNSVRFKKENANVITSGSYWYLPGMGPIVQAPAQVVFGDNPEWQTEEGMKKFLWDYAIAPVGKQDTLDYLVPSATLREMVTFVQGEDNMKFKGLENSAYQMLYTRWVAEGSNPADRPTQEEASEIARSVQATNILGRFFTPAAYQSIPEGKTPSGHSGQFLIDQARSYQTIYGFDEGVVKFLEDFGEDNYIWLTSTSNSNGALPPTGRAWRGWKAYGEEIRHVPELALAIVGMDAQDDEFNMAVYQEQMGLGQRERLSPDQLRDKAEREQGWREWSKWKTAIDEGLAARGLSSTQDRGAEDLAIMDWDKQQELRSLYPGWASDFDEFSTGKGYETVEAFRELVARGDGDFLERPDWKYGVTRYLELHDAVAEELELRKRMGGSADLTAQSNADLNQIWQFSMGELVQDNPMFANVYHRYLENHVPTKGTYNRRPEEAAA